MTNRLLAAEGRRGERVEGLVRLLGDEDRRAGVSAQLRGPPQVALYGLAGDTAAGDDEDEFPLAPLGGEGRLGDPASRGRCREAVFGEGRRDHLGRGVVGQPGEDGGLRPSNVLKVPMPPGTGGKAGRAVDAPCSARIRARRRPYER